MNERYQSLFERHPGLTIAAILLLFFGGVELALHAAAEMGMWTHQRFRVTERPDFWADINEEFGVWHHPDRELHQDRSCFDVVYRTNADGARDRPRTRSADGKRFVVLGDSFVEGYGVARQDRFSDVLEARTGLEFLNFGISGNFGSIQEWLLYRSLARKFDHEAVLLFMFPTNDFEDNDPTYFPEDRYRPYLRRKSEDAGFSLYYPVPFAERGNARLSRSRVFFNGLLNRIYVANFVYGRVPQLSKRKDRSRVSYNTFTDEDLEIALYSYDQIAGLAAPGHVYLFTIPRPNDFQFHLEQGYRFELVDALSSYADGRSNLSYHDLLPEFTRYTEERGGSESDIFLSCDGHWSPLGHEIVAGAVLKAIRAELE